MATGDATDFVARLRQQIPNGWFPDSAPILNSLLTGFATGFARIYSALSYVKAQSRIATATGVWLDGIAADFFGPRFQRRNNELDSAFRVRVANEVLRPRATRAAIIQTLTDLTGRAPVVFEPSYAFDTGAYSAQPPTPWVYNYDMLVSGFVGPEWVTRYKAAGAYANTNKAGVAGLYGPAPAVLNGSFTMIIEWAGSVTNDQVFGLTDGSGFSNSLYSTQSNSQFIYTALVVGGVGPFTSGVPFIPGQLNRLVISLTQGFFIQSANGSAPISTAFTQTLPTWSSIGLGCNPFGGNVPPPAAMSGAPTRLTIYPVARSAADVQRLSVVGYQPGLEAAAAAWMAAAYNVDGGYGSYSLPFQIFVNGFRQIGRGIGYLPGWGSSQGAYNTGSLAYGTPAFVGNQVSDAEMFANVAAAMPVASTAWTTITS